MRIGRNSCKKTRRKGTKSLPRLYGSEYMDLDSGSSSAFGVGSGFSLVSSA